MNPTPYTLNLATWVPCTTSEGPGVRFALWVQGCPIRCPGCCNPEMFSSSPKHLLPIDDLLSLILDAQREHHIEGISALGGEPFTQSEALGVLAEKAQQYGLSVMIFSGYTLEEIQQQGEHASKLLEHTDILVDGRYEQSLHTDQRRWIGSTNQQIHFLTKRYQAEDSEWNKPNSIDIHFDGKELFITGFPDGPWKETLQIWQAWQKKRRG